MDAMDILGSLLGRKSSRAGKGSDILKDIFNRKTRPTDDSRTAGSRSSSSQSSGSRSTASPDLRPGDIQRESLELEDLLNVANQRNESRNQGRSQSRRAETTRREPQNRNTGFSPDVSPTHGDRPTDMRNTDVRNTDVRNTDVRTTDLWPGQVNPQQDQQAIVLVRAMVNAAKADGQLDHAEQQAILDHVGKSSPDTIQFLREEFAKPLDVREFAWSVPIGMEQHVYTMSLIAIDVDTRREASYLRDLAHGLRIPENVCQQIERRLAAS